MPGKLTYVKVEWGWEYAECEDNQRKKPSPARRRPEMGMPESKAEKYATDFYEILKELPDELRYAVIDALSRLARQEILRQSDRPPSEARSVSEPSYVGFPRAIATPS